MKNVPLDRSGTRQSRGFSLIELMVGLVLGMIAVIVVMQVFSLSERNKRTTTGGDDATINGALGLAQLQRDVRQSGQGMSTIAVTGCDLQLPGGWTISTLGPVTINHASVPAGDANTDTLLVVYGSSVGSPEGDRINAQPDAATYSVATPSAFALQDLVVAASQTQPASCDLLLDRITAKVGAVIGVANGGVGTRNVLYNWGQTPRVLVYAIRDGRLTQCDFMINDCTAATSAFWVQMGDGVVSLRAQYGRDTTVPMDGNIDVFDRTSPTTNCGWARTSAIRLALTTRSGQQEKADVTANAPTWAGTGGAPIVLSTDSLWKRYRYKVFESVVPLRNMAWQGVQTPC